MKNILRKTPTVFLAAGLFVAAANTGSAQRGNAAVQFAGQTIDEMVAGFMRENHIPGMTLAIVQAPYISRVTGYGFADQEKGLLASPKTLWNIGQLTEAHTVVAILQLVEAGKLSLEDSIGQHVNGLPETWRQVTLRQLLAHASGLPDYTQQPSYRAARKPRPEGVLELMKDTPTVFPPGARVANSATDTMLLRLTVERVSGTNYEAERGRFSQTTIKVRAVAAIHEVIQGTKKLNTQRAGHGVSSPKPRHCRLLEPTPSRSKWTGSVQTKPSLSRVLKMALLIGICFLDAPRFIGCLLQPHSPSAFVVSRHRERQPRAGFYPPEVSAMARERVSATRSSITAPCNMNRVFMSRVVGEAPFGSNWCRAIDEA